MQKNHLISLIMMIALAGLYSAGTVFYLQTGGPSIWSTILDAAALTVAILMFDIGVFDDYREESKKKIKLSA